MPRSLLAAFFVVTLALPSIRAHHRDCNRNGVDDGLDLRLPRLGFVRHDTVEVAGDVGQLEVSDLDGDLDNDLVVRYFDAPIVAILDNTGDGFRVGQTLQIMPFAGIRLNDLEGDGDIDLVSATRQTLQLFENDGSGRFTTDPGFSSSLLRV